MVHMLRPRVQTLDTRIARPAPKVADAFYSTPEWIELRNRTRRECRGRCQTKGCNNPGRYVDHIVELKDGGAPLDRKNTTLLCGSCHTTKTAVERARRMAR
jgi:5-methylcytosine-specific restriction protein A